MKKLVKAAVLAICYALVFPSGCFARLAHRVSGSGLLSDFFAQSYALVPGLPGRLSRACYCQQTLKRAFLDLDIGFASVITKIDASIGRGVLITGYTTIGLADIEDGAVVANHVSILSGRYQHNFVDSKTGILEGTGTYSLVHIGTESFIGENSVIMATVGAHSIVGAGSVVVKPIPDYVVAAGNPARVIRQRSQG
jgi:virginiamycin A acetyltransferase